MDGDGQGRSHSSPCDKFDDAEGQRQHTTTTIVCTTENEDCRASEDCGGQREQQPQPEEYSLQLGVGRSPGNDHHASENECRPTYQQVAKADHATSGAPEPPVSSHEPWKHSMRVASMSTGTQHHEPRAVHVAVEAGTSVLSQSISVATHHESSFGQMRLADGDQTRSIPGQLVTATFGGSKNRYSRGDHA
ncbi:MAG TPA: hypothetical protein VFX53_00335 [Pedococcus sp.]|nr:hypothetical protein [Pedococcus sp.]